MHASQNKISRYLTKQIKKHQANASTPSPVLNANFPPLYKYKSSSLSHRQTCTTKKHLQMLLEVYEGVLHAERRNIMVAQTLVNVLTLKIWSMPALMWLNAFIKVS